MGDGGALLALMIGLRHEVGDDWFNYLNHFKTVARMDFAAAMKKGDPGHYFLNWLSWSFPYRHWPVIRQWRIVQSCTPLPRPISSGHALMTSGWKMSALSFAHGSP